MRLAALLLSVFALISVGSSADAATERAKQKKQAEAQRAALQEKLAQLKHEIDDTEAAKTQASDALAESEAAISDADRELHDLNIEQQGVEAKLAKIVKQQEDLKQAVDLQQQKLSKVLREQYISGNEDRIKLLLSGDNPNRINRDLQYMGYISQAQAKLITSLRGNLQALEANKEETQEAKDELDEIAQEQLKQKAELERQKAQRAQLLTKLSSKLTAQRKEVGNVEHNEQRLGELVDKLGKLIEEQQKEEVAAARKREEAAARAKAEAEKRAQALAAKQQAAKAANAANPTNPVIASIAPNVKPSTPEAKLPNPADAIDADEPPANVGTPTKVELTPVPKVEEGVFPHDFESLRGQLRLPVRGELVAKFGGKHGDGPSWKGVFIRTDEGAEVRAVAGGRVVFAEWMRGFGNLIIVDHGNQYMTIYGNNQAVLKRAGDVVKAGEVIANAGNSGGNEQSGLYFEMRHQGRAFDPLGWVTIK